MEVNFGKGYLLKIDYTNKKVGEIEVLVDVSIDKLERTDIENVFEKVEYNNGKKTGVVRYYSFDYESIEQLRIYMDYLIKLVM